MDTIKIKEVNIEEYEITVRCSAEGEVSKAFCDSEFDFTYRSSIPLEDVPESIAVIPALGTLLPPAWLFDAEITVDECDAGFVNSVPDIKKGYMDMYPEVRFGGKLTVGKIVENDSGDHDRALTLFSGGVDSHDTALRHAAEKPDLLILRGADISIFPKDDEGWSEMISQVDHFAGILGVSRLSVASNFRRVVDSRFLNSWTTDVAECNGSYWYCFQHGLSMLALAAPVAWCRNIRRVYIASSFDEESGERVQCASDPSIDNNIRFFGAEVHHDGYQSSRIEKLRHITKWADENDKAIYLRVCHSRPNGIKNGRNCCMCEKCFRTICALYALHEDPNRFGFEVKDIVSYMDMMHGRAFRLVRHFNTRYIPLIKLMRENYSEVEVPDEVRWLYDLKLGEDSEYFKWVDRRVAFEYEKALASAVEKRALERQAARLQDRVDILRERLNKSKERNRGLRNEIRKSRESEKEDSGLLNRIKRLFGND